MTNIPENRNVRRLFYMNISGRRTRRLLGDQHVSEDSGVAVSHGGAEAVFPESEGFSCSGATQHSLDYSSFQLLLFVMSQPLFLRLVNRVFIIILMMLFLNLGIGNKPYPCLFLNKVPMVYYSYWSIETACE